MGFQNLIDWSHSSMLKSWLVSPTNAETVTRQDEVPAGLKNAVKA
jgi:hypothetical protein